jgi:hypothetical protein
LFSFEEIIEHVTRDERLMLGEFIRSGTVGDGCGIELGWYLEQETPSSPRSRISAFSGIASSGKILR